MLRMVTAKVVCTAVFYTRVLAIVCIFGASAGCSRMLKVEEYVPYMLDDLQLLGMFDITPHELFDAISERRFPPSWPVDDTVQVWWHNSSVRFSPYRPPVKFVHNHGNRLYRGTAIIAPVMKEDDSFFEIVLLAASGLFPSPVHSSSALIHARSREDARVIAEGRRRSDLEHASIVIYRERTFSKSDE